MLLFFSNAEWVCTNQRDSYKSAQDYYVQVEEEERTQKEELERLHREQERIAALARDAEWKVGLFH